MIDFDAAIVGYGPVGAVLANLLGAGGLRVVVIEKDPDIFDKPRAIGIDHESLRTLQFCGMGDELPELIIPWRGGTYLGVDGQPIWELVPVGPPFPLGWTPNAAFVQPELETALRRSAEKRPNVQVLLGTRVVDLDRATDFTTVHLSGNGVSKSLRAKYVLGCDGAKSFVRRAIGTTFEDLEFDEWWVVVDALCDHIEALPTSNRQYCWPSRPGTYVVGPRNLRRWEFKVLPGERREDFDNDAIIRKALAKFVDVETIQIWRSAQYRFHAVIAKDWQDGGIFILGDAAHQTPPFLGQGMNSGIRDAANLAWKLIMVERHGADESLLSTYQIERRPHFKAVVERTKQQGLIIGELDEIKAVERDRELRERMARGELISSRQSFIPGLVEGLLHPDNREGKAKLAGALFPQPLIKTKAGRPRLLDDEFGARFLLVLSERAIAWVNECNVSALEDLNAAILVFCNFNDATLTNCDFAAVEDLNGVFTEWMKDKDVGAILVRPDRYIFGAARNSVELNEQIVDLHNRVFAGCGSV